MTERDVCTMNRAKQLVDEWVHGFTRISELPSDASLAALQDLVAAALAQAEREREEFKASSVKRGRELAEARAEVERLKAWITSAGHQAPCDYGEPVCQCGYRAALEGRG